LSRQYRWLKPGLDSFWATIFFIFSYQYIHFHRPYISGFSLLD
jgi:hypothetical protein